MKKLFKMIQEAKFVPLGDKFNFGGHPLSYCNIDNDIIVKCKDVFLSYNRYQHWKRFPGENKIGFNQEGKAAKILKLTKESVQIACLKDSQSNLDQIELLIKHLKNK